MRRTCLLAIALTLGLWGCEKKPVRETVPVGPVSPVMDDPFSSPSETPSVPTPPAASAPPSAAPPAAQPMPHTPTDIARQRAGQAGAGTAGAEDGN
jgi:hypothetical protein